MPFGSLCCNVKWSSIKNFLNTYKSSKCNFSLFPLYVWSHDAVSVDFPGWSANRYWCSGCSPKISSLICLSTNSATLFHIKDQRIIGWHVLALTELAFRGLGTDITLNCLHTLLLGRLYKNMAKISVMRMTSCCKSVGIPTVPDNLNGVNLFITHLIPD
jgi:hypothetical protein